MGPACSPISSVIYADSRKSSAPPAPRISARAVGPPSGKMEGRGGGGEEGAVYGAAGRRSIFPSFHLSIFPDGGGYLPNVLFSGWPVPLNMI